MTIECTNPAQMATETSNAPVRQHRLTFDQVLGLLGRIDGEYTGICHKPVGGSFASAVVESADAAALATSLPDKADTWFSVNPTSGPKRDGGGRGAEKAVTRWAALYLDVDVKDGAFPDLSSAEQFVMQLSDFLGTRPSVVIYSGHGLQPLWPITDGLLESQRAWERACRLSRRFGGFAAHVARQQHSASLDSVSDLARILRVPDTKNWKDVEHPAGVSAKAESGNPLTVDQIEEFLDRWCPQIGADQPVVTEPASAPDSWRFGPGTCAYVRAMVAGWSTDQPQGGRHQWLLDRCVRLAAAHRLGCITEEARDAALHSVEDAVSHWCQALDPRRELEPDEVGGAFRWAAGRVSMMTDRQVRAELGHHLHDDANNEDLYEEFWSSRGYLTTIRQFAYSRMTSPWGVLGAVLCRALTVVPPNVQLPPLIGSKGSLNFLMALVAPSGCGKGACEGVAEELLPVPIHVSPAGSGEGLVHQYAHIEKRQLVRDRTAVMFSVPEVDALTALATRNGSTIMSRLRSAFSGEEIGFSYADPSKRLMIGKHSYRLTMVVGVQPEKARSLLDDAPGGTPQRFLWMPATDPAISEDTPEQPSSLTISEEVLRDAPQRNLVGVPDCAAETIRRAHVARQRGETDALDGHALFVREKVAFALALLDGRLDIDDQDWHLSGIVMRKSDHTRKSVRDTLTTVASKKNEARAVFEAERQVIVDEVASVKRVGKRLVRYLAERGPMTRGAVRKKLASRERQYLDDAVEMQAKAGHVVIGDDGMLSHA